MILFTSQAERYAIMPAPTIHTTTRNIIPRNEKVKGRGASSLHRVTVDIDLAAIALLSKSLRKHQLTHPVNALIAGLDREMMRSPRRGIEDTLLLGSGYKLKGKGRWVAFLLLATDFEGLESRPELVGCDRRASNGIFIHVDSFEDIRRLGVAMHRKPGTVEAEVVFVPLVTQHLCFALLHPAGVVDFLGGGRQLVFAVDGREYSLLNGCHGKAWLAPVGSSRC